MSNRTLLTPLAQTNQLFAFGNTVVNGTKCSYTPVGESPIELTTADSADKYGMKNFNDIIKTTTFKTLAIAADNIVFLGDIVYPESKRLQEIAGNVVTMHLKEKWTLRLNCAWNMFVSQLVSLQLHDGINLNHKVDILTGNHSFDVNFEAEELFNNDRMQKTNEHGKYFKVEGVDVKEVIAPLKRSSYSLVRKLSVYAGARRINFVDFNSAALVSISSEGKPFYDTDNGVKFYQQKWTYEKSFNYYKTLVHVLNSLEDTSWNVMRAHHPPSNFDDGDAEFYFRKVIDEKSLFDIFKLKKVRFFFGSHIHAQAVISVPYNNTLLRANNLPKEVLPLGSYCNPDNLRFGASGVLPNTACTQTTFTVDTLKENVMLIFVSGNSGRFFDPISTGTKTARGNVVWAKRAALKDRRDAFGFAHVIFKEKEVNFEFYELEDVKDTNTYKSKKVATFKVTEDQKSKVPAKKLKLRK
jgi:hypothetical protein